MAKQTTRKQPARGKRTARRTNGKVSSADAIKRAVEQLRELTGRPIDGVQGLARDGDNWIVTVELVELRRVPDSTDVLGSYAVLLDQSGELQEYRRTRRYYRSQVEEG